MNVQKEVQVLIAEDEVLVRKMIQSMLEDKGYRVVGKAANGLKAVETLAQLDGTAQQPDVVLMDLEMPGMDGIEATRMIQERYPTPVVALTAYETESLVGRATAVGVGAYLVKPPDARELDRAIRVAVARFEDLMELRRLNAELEAALAHVKTLSGLLPICASCNKIRDDEGYWQRVEVYIRDHSDADFTHGICPECAMRLYPQLYEDDA
jgi:AmiR/NasT family two-component response regulator